MTTADRVRGIIVEHFGHKAEGIGGDTPLSAVGADSLDRVELEMACEDAFHFRFDDEHEGFGQDPAFDHIVATVDRMVQRAQDRVAL